MAVADAKVSPSPPTARIVLPVPALVPFPFVRAQMLVRARVAGRALLYPAYAVVWVLAAASAAQVVAARAWGEGSVPSVFLQALTDASSKVSLCVAILCLGLSAGLLCALSVVFLIAVICGSGSDFKKRALRAFKQTSAREFPPRTAVLGWVASVPFILLLLIGGLMEYMMPSPVEGPKSKGQIICSVIIDVGVVGTNAISCFVVIPALALSNWRDDQSGRKAGLTV